MSRSFTKNESILYQASDAEDMDTLNAIAVEYGDRLQKLSLGQKAGLLSDLIEELLEERTGAGAVPRLITDQFGRLSNDTLCALVIAVGEQLRADLKHDRKLEESDDA